MGDMIPADSPLTDGECAAWAQPDALPADVRELHTDELWCSVLATASDVLWAATGRRWRNVSITETIEMAGDRCVPLPGPHSRRAHVMGSIRLPRDDVTAVTSVTIGGVLFADWQLDGNWLIRTDARGWSRNTVVSYTFGRMRPAGGELAVLTLATEIGRWMAGKSCQLPQRVQSVTRQGITYAMLDDLSFLDQGLTGIAGVDLWIKSVNPGGNRQQAVSWSPDRISVRRA